MGIRKMDQNPTIKGERSVGLISMRIVRSTLVDLNSSCLPVWHRLVSAGLLSLVELTPSPPMTGSTLNTSVVIPCHTERRWSELCRAIRSAFAQSAAPHAVIVAVDGNVALYEQLLGWSDDIHVVLNTTEPGASATRNTGAGVVETPLIAFLDDDACAPTRLASEPCRAV